MRQTLRLLTSVSLAAIAAFNADAQNVGINRNGAVPNAKAILDLDVSATSGNPFQGMLIPRMTMGQRQAIAGLGAADKGLWVYQTNDGTDPGGDPTLDGEWAKGYWYYEGVNPAPYDWVRWSTGGSSWKLTGNGNTVATTHYLGTPAASNDDLYIRTTNSLVPNPSIRVNATDGFVGINLAAPAVERMEVGGGVQVGNTTANNIGSIKHENVLVTPNRWHMGNVDGLATGWKRMENAETRYINQSYCPIVQQCGSIDGTITKGIYDGSPVAGNPSTPFATNTGSNTRLGHRVQYIYPGAELLASGLCPGNITKFSFYANVNELACTPLVNCPDIIVQIRMGNTAQANFGPLVASQNTPLTVNWDAPTEASANINANLGPILVQQGWIDFTLTGAGFPWTGGNLVLDVSWLRASAIGSSPSVQLEEGLTYTATKWVQATVGGNPAAGWTYQDNPMAGLTNTTGTTQNRPVTRFYGKVSSPGYGAVTTGAFLNYGGGLMIDHNANPLTWADGAYKGPGTIRASLAVYDGNTALSDHVFDKYYEGDVAPEDVKSAEGYTYVGLPALKGYLQNERHLPNMPSREDWESHGSPSLGQLQTGLWESVETQALYITQLENDLSALESIAFGKLNNADEITRLIGDVKNSRRLTEAQKLHLTHALQARMNANTDTK